MRKALVMFSIGLKFGDIKKQELQNGLILLLMVKARSDQEQ